MPIDECTNSETYDPITVEVSPGCLSYLGKDILGAGIGAGGAYVATLFTPAADLDAFVAGILGSIVGFGIAHLKQTGGAKNLIP